MGVPNFKYTVTEWENKSQYHQPGPIQTLSQVLGESQEFLYAGRDTSPPRILLLQVEDWSSQVLQILDQQVEGEPGSHTLGWEEQGEEVGRT